MPTAASCSGHGTQEGPAVQHKTTQSEMFKEACAFNKVGSWLIALVVESERVTVHGDF